MKDKNIQRFAVQLHLSRRKHWDLRLENPRSKVRAMWSFAIPKGLPKKIGDVRLAIKTPDHSYEYSYFGKNKGDRIPEGQYGAGKVILVKDGKYELLINKPSEITFKLLGSNATYTLRKKNSKVKKNTWFIIKRSARKRSGKRYKTKIKKRSRRPRKKFSMESDYYDSDATTISLGSASTRSMPGSDGENDDVITFKPRLGYKPRKITPRKFNPKKFEKLTMKLRKRLRPAKIRSPWYIYDDKAKWYEAYDKLVKKLESRKNS